FFAGSGGPGAATLWRALHEADSRLMLLGSSEMVDNGFAARLGAAAAGAYLTTPILSLDSYPRAAARVPADYRRRFGRAGGAAGQPLAAAGQRGERTQIRHQRRDARLFAEPSPFEHAEQGREVDRDAGSDPVGQG